jgi:hypothetical protein
MNNFKSIIKKISGKFSRHPIVLWSGSLVLGITGSLIAGHFQQNFSKLVSRVNEPLKISWLFLLCIIFLIIIITFFSARSFKNGKLNDGLQKILALDDNLLSLWKEFMKAEENLETNHGIVRVVNCAKEYFDVTIGEIDIGIFRIEKSFPQQLGAWFHTRSVIQNDIRYWVGEGPSPNPSISPRGMVGKTFVEKTIQVTTIKWDDTLKRCVATHEDFYFPYDVKVKANCRYRSMLTIPLKDVHENSIGVVAFYSSFPDTFDTQESKIMPLQISKRIAAALILG